MPVQSIIDNYTTQFSEMVHVAAQQNQSRLRASVQNKMLTGDDYAYDGIGRIVPRELESRVNPATFDDIEHNRRQLTRRDFAINLPIDEKDDLAVLLDPEREYAQACVRAMNQQIDKVIVDALFADIQTGRRFDTTETFAQDGGVTVDATAGLTYEKLLEIKENFIDANVGIDMNEGIVMGITGKEHTSLMQETELTSGDFTRQFAIERGQMINAVGMDIVLFAGSESSPVLDVTGSTRDCF